MEYIDNPSQIRQGEDIDLMSLKAYINEHLFKVSRDIIVKQFPSGFSNLTYMIQIDGKDFVLRKPPHGKKAKTAHDMSREYNILKALQPVFPFVPEPLLYCDDNTVLGSSFYVMERIKGIILRKNLPKGLLLDKHSAGKLCENLISILARLHQLDYRRIGLAEFGKPDGYVQRQVKGWSSRYMDAKTPDAPTFDKVMQWLDDNMPESSPAVGIIHNDYKFDNVVLEPDFPVNIIGVLDWEMATIGDPLMDLGSSLAYWVDHDDPEELQLIRMLPTTLPGMMKRDEIVALYRELTGIKFGSFDFYYCFGLFRLAVIAQQIYYRFYHGQTRDERFKMLIFAVNILEKVALKVIEKNGDL